MKTRPSKLDRFAEQLAELAAQNKTLAEIQAWLAQQSCVVSIARLSGFLSAQRSAAAQAGLLAQISTGARQVKEMEARFAKNPAPELDILIRLYRVLILKLSTQSEADPALMELATAMTKQAMDFEKLQIKRSELDLNREKFEELRKQNADAKEVVHSTLTPAEQNARLREILK